MIFKKKNIGLVMLSVMLFGLIMSMSPVISYAAPTPPAGDFDVKKSKETIWKYLMAQEGATPIGVAGIMGNMGQESTFNPKAMEPGGTGIGLVQWSFTRHDDLVAAAEKDKVDWWDIGHQLKYIMYECSLDYYKTAWSATMGASDLEGSVGAWEKHYEKAGIPAMGKRLTYAQEIFAEFKDVKGDATVIAGGTGGKNENKESTTAKVMKLVLPDPMVEFMEREIETRVLGVIDGSESLSANFVSSANNLSNYVLNNMYVFASFFVVTMLGYMMVAFALFTIGYKGFYNPGLEKVMTKIIGGGGVTYDRQGAYSLMFSIIKTVFMIAIILSGVYVVIMTILFKVISTI